MTRCPLQLRESRAGHGVMSVPGITARCRAGHGVATGVVMLLAPHSPKPLHRPPVPVGSSGTGNGVREPYTPGQGAETSLRTLLPAALGWDGENGSSGTPDQP